VHYLRQNYAYLVTAGRSHVTWSSWYVPSLSGKDQDTVKPTSGKSFLTQS